MRLRLMFGYRNAFQVESGPGSSEGGKGGRPHSLQANPRPGDMGMMGSGSGVLLTARLRTACDPRNDTCARTCCRAPAALCTVSLLPLVLWAGAAQCTVFGHVGSTEPGCKRYALVHNKRTHRLCILWEHRPQWACHSLGGRDGAVSQTGLAGRVHYDRWGGGGRRGETQLG